MNAISLITSDAEFEAVVRHGAKAVDVAVTPWDPAAAASTPISDTVASFGPSAEVVVLGPDLPIDVALDVAGEFDRVAPHVVVVLTGQVDQSLLQRAMRVGVRDVLDAAAKPADVGRVVKAALLTAQRRRESLGLDHDAEKAGRVIAVVSPKGGAGKTTIATNLAVSIGHVLPNDVAIVDLDLQFGDVAAAMQLTPQHTIRTLVRSSEQVDDAMLRVFMTAHPSGAMALCCPESLVEAEEVGYEDVSTILKLVRTAFPVVIIDTAAGLDEQALAAMEIATDLVFVCTMDVASVRCLRKELDAVDRLGLDGVRRHFVLNRSDARVGLTVADVEAAVGMRVDAAIPSSRTIPLAMNQGMPVVENDPRSPVARQLEQLATRFVNLGGGGVEPSRRGWRRSVA